MTNYVIIKEKKARAAKETKEADAKAREAREARATRRAEEAREAMATTRAAKTTTKKVAPTIRAEEETKPRNIFSTIRRTIRGLLSGNKKDTQVSQVLLGGTKRKKRRPKRRTCKQSNY